MPDSNRLPAYHFDFSDGINNRGMYTRTSSHRDDGHPRRLGFFLNDASFISTLGVPLDPLCADILDVFAATAIADRRSPRNAVNNASGSRAIPRRRISLEIGVRCRDLWQRSEIKAGLETLLADLTRDNWDLTFVSRTSTPRVSEVQQFMFARRFSERSIVALHSGGMDSFLGLVGAIDEAKADAILAVSVISHPRVEKLTRAVLASIETALEHQGPDVIGVQFGLHHSTLSGSFAERESSQRTRILPCLAAGVVVAITTGTDRLNVTENGIGAFNLRYTPGQSGAMMNRAMHPRTLWSFANLISELLGRTFTLANDGLFLTKAQLLNRRMSNRFVEALKQTASCERIPWISAHEPCGVCSSCLLRRLSLHGAGLHFIDDIDGDRGVDVLSNAFGLDGKNAIPLLAFAAQADDLRRAMSHVRPSQELRNRFPELAPVDYLADSLGLSLDELQRTVATLYRRHLNEWDSFAVAIPSFRETMSQMPLPLFPERISVAG